MNELEKYELVNKCETIEELSNAIIELSNNNGNIVGRREEFDGVEMSSMVKHVVKNDMRANVLTRKFGIRQQALYLKYYNAD